MTTRSLVSALALLLLVAACGDSPDPVVDPASDPLPGAPDAGLTEETYVLYRAVIGPQPEDAAWQTIDWLPSYREGLEAAAAQQKPILLWVMNGHPLGCT